MLMPIVIQILFWIGVASVVIAGVIVLVNGKGNDRYGGLAMIVLGPLGVRFYAEMLIVIFRMNDTLTDIKNNTAK
jgi:hypothetical protein